MSVRHALLGLLLQEPRHGYELRAAFEALMGHIAWELKPAQVYTTLNRLEEAGLVVQTATEQDGGPERHTYAVTEDGQQALLEWLQSGVPAEHQRDELFVKLLIALASGQSDPARIIQRQRVHLYHELHQATTQREGCASPQQIAQIMLLDKVIMHLEADLRWLDIAEQRIEVLRRQPLPKPEVRPRGRPRKVTTDAVDPPPTPAELIKT